MADEIRFSPLAELLVSMTEVHEKQKAEGGYEAGETTVGYWLSLLMRHLGNEIEAQMPALRAELASLERAKKVSRKLLDSEITI